MTVQGKEPSDREESVGTRWTMSTGLGCRVLGKNLVNDGKTNRNPFLGSEH